ncbi:hypothetical protein [Aquirufa aurantiipilula]
MNTPNEQEIHLLIDMISERLEDPRSSEISNKEVKDGFTCGRDILIERMKETEAYGAIASLTTVRSRAIAMLFYDFLIGESDAKSILVIEFRN